jgi:hypothetical protein
VTRREGHAKLIVGTVVVAPGGTPYLASTHGWSTTENDDDGGGGTLGWVEGWRGRGAKPQNEVSRKWMSEGLQHVRDESKRSHTPSHIMFPLLSHRSCASFQSYPQKYLFSLLDDTTGLGVVGLIVGPGGCGALVSMRASHGVFVKHISPGGQSFRFPEGQWVAHLDTASSYPIPQKEWSVSL